MSKPASQQPDLKKLVEEAEELKTQIEVKKQEKVGLDKRLQTQESLRKDCQDKRKALENLVNGEYPRPKS